MKRSELVIFDCDGVLIDSEVISARMLIDTLKDYGVEMDMKFVTQHFLGRSYPVVLQEVRERWGVVLPDRFEAEYRARLLATFERELRVMPGVVDAILELDRPYCLATSSSPERMRRSLEMTGLASLFGDRCFTASEVSRGKPAPDLFLYAAARMAVEPGSCLVIEDSLNGVRAGLAAGMEVWRFTGGTHLAGLDLDVPEDAVPHAEFDSFPQLYAMRPDLRRPRLAAAGIA
ncbi:HAD family hydrolase [Allitabrizicola rongguiensis]|uniref:HAD family hydrolase n=1 Tax=Alitabrizicola rongguiensis TaxID=2909234 RepID=UPI001F303ADE|nr:HAD family hydrolase [Tabrizicola rongguiensis]